MPLNSAQVTPAVRQPALKVQVNGAACAGFNAFDVTTNGHFSADTFILTGALSALPPEKDAGWWLSGQAATVEIFADDTGAGNFVSLILGQVDYVEIDLIGRKITLSGRDLSAQLMDAKTTERWEELTSSQIVELLAARHGLTANAQSTSTKVGRYYEVEHARVTQEQSEWDLLTYLAQEEGFDLWVSGNTLNFQPPPALTSEPYLLQWSQTQTNLGPANFKTMKVARSLTLARDVVVQISTWNQFQETAIVHKVQATPSGGAAASGPAQVYSFTLPNLEPAKALQWAQNKVEEITQHERLVTFEVPADNILTSRTIVQVTGTNTSADQSYRVSSIERSMSFSGAYAMTVRLKNHSPQDTKVSQ